MEQLNLIPEAPYVRLCHSLSLLSFGNAVTDTRLFPSYAPSVSKETNSETVATV